MIPRNTRCLLDLLAIIHRDGGHYTEKHGIEKSAKDAMQLSSERLSIIDKKTSVDKKTLIIILKLTMKQAKNLEQLLLQVNNSPQYYFKYIEIEAKLIKAINQCTN